MTVGCSYRDDDLAASVAVREVTNGVGELSEGEVGADDRRELPGFDELPQGREVALAVPMDERTEPVPYER